MGRNSAYHKINYDTFTFDGCLTKIINRSALEANKVPTLEKAWTVKFEPSKSKSFLRFIKEEIGEKDAVSFQYLKRIRKSENAGENAGTKTLLWAIVCSADFIEEEAVLRELLAKYDVAVEQVSIEQIPSNYPYDKSISDEWSEKYWPTIWKGSPIIQDLNQVKLCIQKERQYLVEISEESKKLESQGKLPIVVMFRDPENDSTVVVSGDQRNGDLSTLDHCIMDGIKKVAELEVQRRKASGNTSKKNYLCLNYHVYITHEPCAMCVMALIHSRIGKLTYIKSMPGTGAVEETSGLGHGFDKFSGLNWKFDSWKWTGDELGVPELDQGTDADAQLRDIVFV